MLGLMPALLASSPFGSFLRTRALSISTMTSMDVFRFMSSRIVRQLSFVSQSEFELFQMAGDSSSVFSGSGSHGAPGLRD